MQLKVLSATDNEKIQEKFQQAEWNQIKIPERKTKWKTYFEYESKNQSDSVLNETTHQYLI